MFATQVYAQCSADVSFRALPTNQADVSGTNPAVHPTVTGLRLPTGNTDIANKLYVDRINTRFAAYLPVATNINGNSPLAINYAGTDIANTKYKRIDISTSGAGAMFTDAQAAHPRSHKSDSRYQIDFTYPSVFTEETRTDNQDSQQIEQYFLSTSLLKSGDNTQDTVGLQTLLEVPPDANNGALGTLGGVYNRYRDAGQYTSEWSTWQRLDNRQVDAQFARVDYLKFDGNIVSVDALTPFASNLAFDPVSAVADAKKARTNTINLPLHIAAKGTGVIKFGNHTNSQHNSGALNDTYGVSIAASAQTIQTTGSLQFDTASWFDMDAATLRNIPNFTAVAINAPTATGAFADISVQGTHITSSSNAPLVFKGANNQVVFGDGTNQDRHTLSAIATATIDNNNMILANNSISTISGGLQLAPLAGTGIEVHDRLTNIARLRISNLVFDDTQITSSSGTITMSAANNVIDFRDSSWINVAGGITIDETIAFHTLTIDDLVFTNSTIRSSSQNITIDSNSSNINFASGNLINIQSAEIDEIQISSGRITSTGQMEMIGTGSGLSFSHDDWVDVDRIMTDELQIRSGLLRSLSGITLAAANNNISFDNKQLRGISELRVGTLRLTGDRVASTSTINNLEIHSTNGGDGDVNFNQSKLDTITSITVDNLQLTTSGIESTASGQNMAINSNTGIVLGAGGNVDFGGLGLRSAGTSNTNSDIALKGYVDARQLGVDFAQSNGNWDMNHHKITNSVNPVNDNDAATLGYLGSRNRIATLTTGNLDVNGNQVINLQANVSDDDSPLQLKDLGTDVSKEKIEVAAMKFRVNTHGRMTYIDGTPAGSVTGNLKFVYATGIRDGAPSAQSFDDQRVVGFYWDDATRRQAWVSIYCNVEGAQGTDMVNDSAIYLALDDTTLKDFSLDSTLQIDGSFADVESYVNKTNSAIPLVSWEGADHKYYTSLMYVDTATDPWRMIYPADLATGPKAETIFYNDLVFNLPAQSDKSKRTVVYVISPDFRALTNGWSFDVDPDFGRVVIRTEKNGPTHYYEHWDVPDYSRLGDSDRTLGYCSVLIRLLPPVFIP